MKIRERQSNFSLEELEKLYEEEDNLLKDLLSEVDFVKSTDRFKLPVSEEERQTKKRFICTIIRDIYNATDDENVKKLALEAGIVAKRMTKALAEYRIKRDKDVSSDK